MFYSSQQMVLNSPCLTHKKELIHHEGTALSWLVQKQTALGKDTSNSLMADNLPKIVWFSTHHINCMKSWLVQKQTALGKDTSNSLMADNLPKIVWFSTHHINCMKSWLVQKQTDLGKDTSNPLIADSLLKTIWFSIYHHLTIEVLAIPGQTATAVVKRSGDVTRLQALVDKKRIVITEEVVHEILQLDDAEGVICLPNDEIFAGLARMGYEKPSTKLTFYKAFFLTQWKVGKGFSGVETPLFKNMLAVRAVDAAEEVQVPAQDDVAQENVIEEVAAEVVPPTPTSPSPSSPVIPSSPPHQSPSPPQSQAAEGSSTLVQQVAVASTPISAAKPGAKPKVLKITAAALAVSTRKRKGVVIRDPKEELHDDTPAETLSVKDKGKGILVEDPKPMKKKDQIEMDAEYVKRLQEEELEKGHGEVYKNIDWNTAYDHVQSKGTQYIKRYHGYNKKPQSESKARKNMIAYLKNIEVKRRDGERKGGDHKSINETPAQKAAKRRKQNKEA
nr:hypothetical protein [Tanacetum cinerariifolium]